jgi:hypothetical protein
VPTDRSQGCAEKRSFDKASGSNATEQRSLGFCSTLSLRAGTSQNDLDTSDDNPEDGKAPDDREIEDNPDGKADDAADEPIIQQRPITKGRAMRAG